MANLKRATVTSDVLGKSGRAILTAIIGQQQDPEVLAELARGRLRAKFPQLRKVLGGRVEPYHRLLIERILAHIALLKGSILMIEQDIQERLAPIEATEELLGSIPVLQEAAITTNLSEIGVAMDRFPSE